MICSGSIEGVCQPLTYTHKQVFVKINFMRESQKVKASFVYLQSNDVSNEEDCNLAGFQSFE
jgi:hypothetical protein